MTGVRFTSDFLVRALIRRVHDAGGSAMVLRKGDATSGALLIVVEHRDTGTAFYERGLGADGTPALIRTGPNGESSQEADAYRMRRAGRDPDLWIVELSVPDAERFAAETIMTT